MFLLKFFHARGENATAHKGYEEEFDDAKAVLKRLETLPLDGKFELYLAKESGALHILKPHEVVQIVLWKFQAQGTEEWSARLPSNFNFKPLAHSFLQNEGVSAAAELLDFYTDQEEYRKKVKLEAWRATQAKGRKALMVREWQRWLVTSVISALLLGIFVFIVTRRERSLPQPPSTRAIQAFVVGTNDVDAPEPYQLIFARYTFLGKDYVRPVVVKGRRNYLRKGDSVELHVHVFDPEQVDFVP